MRRQGLLTPMLALTMTSCGGGTPTNAPATPEAAPPAPEVRFEKMPDEQIGLKMTFRDARPQDAATQLPRPATTPLSKEDAEKLLARVPAVEDRPDDRQPFALRKGPIPPPQTGDTVQVAFPPPVQQEAPEVATGPLTVVRYAPEGAVPMVPSLSVTFSQPMVAVTSQEEAAKTVPVQVSPQPKGRWRWLGTKTIVFDPDPVTDDDSVTGRFPMATQYKVTIPAGTKSAIGGSLDKETSFTFETPPVQVRQVWPTSYQPQKRDPVLFVAFDQAVDAAVVASKVSLTSGGRSYPVRMATNAEIEADEVVKNLVKQERKNRWIAVKPTEPLPVKTTFALKIPKGTPSVEGPLTSRADYDTSFFTYAPLEITRHECSWGGNECPPTAPWSIELNNPLDAKVFDPGAWKVEPAVPGLMISGGYGNWVSISGQFQGRTTYTVTVPAGLKDHFGQTLGKDQTLTFKVGPAEKTLTGPADMITVLDPSAKGQVSIHSTNHKALKVRLYEVQPDQYASWVKWMQRWQYDDATPGTPPGKKVRDDVVKIEGEPDRMTETVIDLSKHLTEGHGQFILAVEPTVQPKERWERQYVFSWLQQTDLGLTAFSDNHDLVGWASDLATGNPIEGAEIYLLGPDGKKAFTAKDGLASLALPAAAANREVPQVLVARKGTDVAILPEDTNYWGGSGAWVRSDRLVGLRWYVFDDRGLYKPGEQARIKGWLRRYDPNKGGDVRALDQGPTKLAWTLTDPVGNDIGKGEAKVSGLGGFDFAVDVPKDVNLGNATLRIVATDAQGVVDTTTYHNLNIQEFRRPEFEVSTSIRNEKPHVLGEDVFASVTASYFAGGGLPGADTSWAAYATPTSFTPPNRDEWSFGTWSPWWWWGAPSDGTNVPAANWRGKTDPSGEHPVAIHLDALNPAKPMSVRVEATVFDVNRQAWTSGGDFLVHPADVYVGLKTARSFVDKGQPFDIESLVVDLDGKAVSNVQVDLSIARKEWGWKDGRYQEQVYDEKSCQMKSAADAQKCTFQYDVGGSYAVTATIQDTKGRKNVTELRVWVEGGDTVPARDVQMEQALLIPEKDTFQPGDTAKFLVQAPFYPAEGTLTVRRSGLVTTRRFHMDAATTTLEVPITEDLIPNVRVQVDLVGQAVRVDDHGKKQPDLPKRTAFASGGLDLKVPPLKRTLKVEIAPSATMVAPGGASDLALTVLDADGKPVPNAEVAVVVADESVLSLTGYKIPDPMELFYAARDPGVQDRYLRRQVLLANPAGPLTVTVSGALGALGYEGDMNGLGNFGRGGGGTGQPMPDATVAAEAAPAAPPMELAAGAKRERKAEPMKKANRAMTKDKGGADEENQHADGGQIAMRTDFSALALFAPEVRTDAMGRAIVPLKVPDSLTRYRVMVVAVAGGQQFGMGESNVTARLPLMVRPSAPRFLNFGDQLELPIVLQNQTDAPMDVDVALRGTNVTFLEKLGGTAPDALVSVAGLKVTVPANDRVEVRFPAATSMAGTARFQAVAASGSGQDASTFELPVWTPATTEAFATYGDVASGAAVQPILTPPDVWPQFGGLEVTTSSTQLQALTDSVLYLTKYPYDCNEQIASRMLAIAALRDVLDAFHSEELPPAEVLRKSVDDDMARLERRQNWNGGWSFWRKGDQDWPYLTIHVAESLAQAKAKGYAVPQPMWDRTLGYLRTIESHIPHWYSQESKWSLRAFALDARDRMGDADLAEAKRLYKEAGPKGLELDGQAWILPTLAKGKAPEAQVILKNLSNNATETAGAAHFVTGYSDGQYVLLNSDRRADGIVLDALLRVQPSNDLVPKVVRGLLANRTRGHWLNTQENAYVLLAMDRYFHEYEKETPDFVARVWLGDGYAGDHQFKGRTTEKAEIDVPMALLTENKGQVPLTIQRDGASGRLYYRVGMRYAPKDLDLKPLDDGFAVTRLYEAIDDPGDVKQDADGTWRIKAGSRVRVRLSMVAPARRYHVALVDPLPAGLEVVNPDLATSGTLPADPNAQIGGGKYWWWARTWYEHENLRDDRVEAFSSLVWDGVHEYTYVARATTPGRFVVPPTKAEEMYMPETFGRAATDRVVIE